MNVDVRAELLRLASLPSWGRAQHDDWDTHSDFIYHIHSLDDLRQKTREVAATAGLPLDGFARYVVHRWYNYHTHQVVLDILCAHPRVRREANPRHRQVDLYLDGVPFDLKLTPLPRAYPHDLAHAQARPEHLVNWLYRNQSTQRRYHTANRLFMLLYHAGDPRRAWEVRRMFDLLGRCSATFLEDPRLIRADFRSADGQRQRPWAGVIPCIYEAKPELG